MSGEVKLYRSAHGNPESPGATRDQWIETWSRLPTFDRRWAGVRFDRCVETGVLIEAGTIIPVREPPKRHPLIDFADRWAVDGDYIRCRSCDRPQQSSWMLHDFPHASHCRKPGSERNPWLTLRSLINAQMATAKPVCEAVQ